MSLVVFTFPTLVRLTDLSGPFEYIAESPLHRGIPALLALFQLAVGCTAEVIIKMEKPGVTLLAFLHTRVATQIPGAYLKTLWSLHPQSPAH